MSVVVTRLAKNVVLYEISVALKALEYDSRNLDTHNEGLDADQKD